MSVDMHISTWHNRVNGVIENPEVFSKVMQDLYGVALNDAVASLGIGPREYLCLKELSVPVKLDFSRSTRAIARTWSAAFKNELEAKFIDVKLVNNSFVDDKPDAVVHYRSLNQAHIDCLEGVLSGDLRRQWAWQQAGVFNLSSRAEKLDAQAMVDCWSQDSSARGLYQIAVWRHMLASPKLSIWLHRLSSHHYTQHLVALEKQYSVNMSGLHSYLQERFSGGVNSTRANDLLAVDSIDRNTSVLRLPELMRSKAFQSALRSSKPEQFEFLLSIAILLCEPQTIKYLDDVKSERLEKICDGIETLLSSASIVGSFDDSSNTRKDANHVHKRDALSSETNRQGNAENKETTIQSETVVAIYETETDYRKVADSADQKVANQAESEPVFTQFGGLFWLFNSLLRKPDLLPQLLSEPALASQTQSGILSWMARQLLPVPGFETPIEGVYRNAIMLFAGVNKADEFDELLALPLDLTQQKLILAAAAELKAEFLDSIRRSSAENIADYETLIRRKAEIRGDGQWIEVIYSSQDVDIEVRRAGLDANPDFIPWLGLVVRFVYA